ncbi:hypothetical protein [Rhodoglobus aureus]|uniref:hypothetical protein n=1 Tax=Rhodoglobus aureus TaxID=191497 RepID=UPI0031DF6DDE
MTNIALFHSLLGARPGFHDAAERLRAEGHDVTAVDQYDGLTFDSYDEASEFAEAIGYPALMGLAAQSVAHLPDGFIAAGFSNGGGMGIRRGVRLPRRRPPLHRQLATCRVRRRVHGAAVVARAAVLRLSPGLVQPVRRNALPPTHEKSPAERIGEAFLCADVG